MSVFKFYLFLILTALVCLIISLYAPKTDVSGVVANASYGIIAFFVFFTSLIFQISERAVRSTNPFLFTRVFLVSISLKIVFLSMLVIIFVKLLGIKPRELVLPLISSYLLFTILETWVLMKMAKMK